MSEVVRATIRPILDLISGTDSALAAHAIATVAALQLDVDAWRAVDDVVRARLSAAPTVDAVRNAAGVPLFSVREVVRSFATSGEPELARAALDGLVEARDTEAISQRIPDVIDHYGWEALYPLPTETLAQVDLGERPDDPDEALGWTVLAAKAGDASAIRAYVAAIRRGDGPQLFWGDPAYVASLLESARPMPDYIAEVLCEEWSSLDPLSSEARDVGILIEGLIGPDGCP